MPDVPGDPIAVSAATGSAFEAESAGPQEGVSIPAGCGQKPGLPGLDSDASMRRLFASEQRATVAEAAHTNALGPLGIRAEDVGLFCGSALWSSSPGSSGFVPSSGRERIFEQTWD